MCNCIKEVNKELESRNTELDLSFFFDGRVRVKLAVRKKDRNNRMKPTTIIPAYCPFCGLLYPDKIEKTK